jgi:hypothetical protein
MSALSTASISLDRVQRVLWNQLEHFQIGFDEHPIPENQDLRALSIAWIAVFLKEAVPPSFVETLMALVLRFRARADFSNFGWYRVSPLDIALFASTGDRAWLCDVASNLDHHKRSLRRFVVNSFALVANRVTFDREMLDRTAHNLQVRHSGCEELAVLFATSDLTNAEKKKQISQWLSQFRLNPHEEECLRHLAAGEYVVNQRPQTHH